jgi:hypothetical protein
VKFCTFAERHTVNKCFETGSSWSFLSTWRKHAKLKENSVGPYDVKKVRPNGSDIDAGVTGFLHVSRCVDYEKSYKKNALNLSTVKFCDIFRNFSGAAPPRTARYRALPCTAIQSMGAWLFYGGSGLCWMFSISTFHAVENGGKLKE